MSVKRLKTDTSLTNNSFKLSRGNTSVAIPNAPTIGTATAGTNAATVAFTPSALGATASLFTATSSPGSITGTSASSPITVSGLTAGTAYTFTVTATGVNGVSAPSAASNSVTPTAPPITYFSGITDVQDNSTPTTRDTEFYRNALDSSNNYYGAGLAVNSSGVMGAYLQKIDNTAASVASKFYVRTGAAGLSTELFRGIRVDSSGNIYLAGNFYEATGGVAASYKLLNLKLNSSYTSQFNNYIDGGAYSIICMDIAYDSVGNSYIVGYESVQTSGATNRAYIIKYNSSGSVVWQRQISTTLPSYFRGVVLDSSDNVYCAGYFTSSATNNPQHAQIMKWDSSGTKQWHTELIDPNYPNTNSGYAYFPVLDSSGNIYTSSYQLDGAYQRGTIYKANTSGTGTLGIQLYSTNQDVNIQRVLVDSSGNIYGIGNVYDTTAVTKGLIAKWNSSGTLQWVRTLKNNTAGTNGQTIFYYGALTTTEDISVSGYIYNSAGGGYYVAASMVVKSDGSGTGTFSLASNSMTYAADTSFTNRTFTPTSNSLTYTITSNAYSSSTTTLTVTTPNSTVFSRQLL